MQCGDPAQTALMSAVINASEKYIDELLGALAYKLAKATWGD
jgi:hypothetical protein